MIKRKREKVAAVLLILSILCSAFPAIASTSPKIIFAYLYMGPNEKSQAAGEKFKTQVTAAAGTIDIVAPNWLNITDGAGTILDRTNQEFIDWAHTQGLKVVPMVSKDFSASYIQTVLGNPVLRAKLVQDLLSKVDQYNYDGLNIDFEGAGLEQPVGAFPVFIEELAAGLHSRDKLATIAVMPKTGPKTPSWLGEYDYPILGQTMDYVIVMAYDQHYAGGAPGPVAGFDWVQKTIAYAVSVIDSDKVIMGAPLYGRHWKNSKNGGGISAAYAVELSQQTGTTILWDGTAQTPHFSYQDSQGIDHQIWFDNKKSLTSKMQLAKSLNLGGAAFWRLGYEDTVWWPDLAAHLEGTAVSDTQEEQAQPEQNPAVQNQPEQEAQPISRANTVSFSDIAKHKAKTDILALAEKKIINGFPDGTFRPEAVVTREQILIMLARAYNLPVPKEKSGLKDIPANHRSANYIYAAKAAGIINGYKDGSFRPEKTVTRAEAAKMLVSVQAWKDNSTVKTTISTNTSFKDVPRDYWAAQEIANLKGWGINAGYADGTFRPNAPATRAVVAEFLNKAMQQQKNIL